MRSTPLPVPSFLALPACLALLLGPGPDGPATAEELVREAAAVQGVESLKGGLRDFTLECDVHAKSGENSATGKAEQVYKAPNLLYTRFVDDLRNEAGQPVTTLERGSDGRQYWDRTAGKITILKGDRYKKDREELERQLRLIRFFSSVYFLTQKPEITYERLPDVDGPKGKLRVLRRLEKDQEPVLLRLNDKNLIVEVELTGGAFGPGRTRIELRGHQQKSGFLVPVHVKVFSGEPETEDLRAFVREIKVNSDPPESLFRPK
jgi:hypothetical protein